MADRALALDYGTRIDLAWSAIATALYDADSPPPRPALIRVGWQAIYDETRDLYRGRGYTDRHTPTEIRPRFVMFWGSPIVPSHENAVVERVAVRQLLGTLKPIYRDAVVALAVHGNYQDAAAAMGLNQPAFNFRIAHARKSLLALWLEHETPHRIRQTDRRVVAAGKALATHCGKGHEFTPENTRIRNEIVRGKQRSHRVCRACKRDRDEARRARKRAA